jgi:hypothetical protein
MPVLTQTTAINDSIWSVTFAIQPGSLSQSDQQLISKFGELPLIQTGGSFASGGLAYTLPSLYIRIVSDLPFTQSFDSTTAPFNQGFSSTNTQVQDFITAFLSTYEAAFATLRANTDTFSKQVLVTV